MTSSVKLRPSDWERVPLGEVATFTNGRGFKPNEWSDSGLPIIRIQNLNGSDEFNRYTGDYNPRILIEPGDLLFAWSGSRGSSFGPHIWDRDFTGLLNYHTWKVAPSKRIEPDFLYQLLQEITVEIENTAHGAAALVHIQKGWIESWVAAIPGKSEQKVIATILKTWDRAAEVLYDCLEKKCSRKENLMHQLLSGEKRLPGFTEEWQEVRLKDILNHVFRPVEWAPDKIFNLISIRRRSGGLFRREPLRGDEYKTKDLHEIHGSDFLISKRQVSHGALAMVRTDFHGCHVSKEYTILENKDPDRLHMPFFDWLSRTKRMWWLTYVASNGVVIEKLIFAPQVFLKFSIKIPPTLEEQERIVELLETCDREIELHRRQLEAIREQKRGLMQKLLTGEVRVKV